MKGRSLSHVVAAVALVYYALAPAVRAQDKLDELSLKANAAQDAGRFDEAIKCWDAVLEIDPKNADAYYNRANAHKGAKEWDKALADTDEALKLSPKDGAIYFLRGDIYIAQKNGTQAEAYTKQWMMTKAIEEYETSLRMNLEGKENPQEWMQGQVDNGHLSSPQKVPYLRTLVKLDPKNIENWMKLGKAEEDVLSRAGALEAYGQAIQLDPDRLEAYQGRIRIYQRLNFKNDGPRLVADCGEVIRLKPTPDVYSTRGGMNRDMKVYDKAIEDFNTLVKLQPDKPLGHEGLASVYEHKEDWDNAIAEYGEVLKIRNNAYVYMERGRAYLKKKDYDKAIDDFTMYSAQTPQGMTGYCLRGDAYAAKGEYEKAVEDYATGMKADNITAYFFAARFYSSCKEAKYHDPAKAVELQTRACEIGKWEGADFIDILACLEADTGAWEKAVEHEKQAIARYEEEKKRAVGIDKAYECETSWWKVEECDKGIARCTARMALFEQKKPCPKDENGLPAE